MISAYGGGQTVEKIRQDLAYWGALLILVKGFTPIPFKFVTITLGFAGYNLWLFVIFAAITRGMRFYIEAFLLNRYGAKARGIIEERLGFWFTVSVGVFLVGIVAAVYLV